MNTFIVVCEFQIKHTMAFKSVYEKKRKKVIIGSMYCIIGCSENKSI